MYIVALWVGVGGWKL